MAKGDFDDYRNRDRRIKTVPEYGGRRSEDHYHDHVEVQKPQHVENSHDETLRYSNDVGEKWTSGWGSP